jgi:hypothetical protein
VRVLQQRDCRQVGLGLIDQNLRYMWVNRALAGLNAGPAPEGRSDRTILELNPARGRQLEIHLWDAFRTGKSATGPRLGEVGVSAHAGGRQVVSFYPLAAEGEPMAVLEVVEDASLILPVGPWAIWGCGASRSSELVQPRTRGTTRAPADRPGPDQQGNRVQIGSQHLYGGQSPEKHCQEAWSPLHGCAGSVRCGPAASKSSTQSVSADLPLSSLHGQSTYANRVRPSRSLTSRITG